MNTFQFISTLISALAWPIVVLIIVFVLKEPIILLISYLDKVKYKDLEIGFGRKLSEIELNVENNKAKQKGNINDNETEDFNIAQIQTVAEVSPAAAITMSWSMVEKELQSLIMRLSISPDYPPYNSVVKNIQILHDNNLIDDMTVDLFNEMRVLRNSSVHGHKKEETITISEAIRYYNVASKMVKILKSIQSKEI